MSSLPFPIPAVPISVWAAASHVAPGLVAPFFRRMLLTPRRDVRPAPRLELPDPDERIDLDEGLVAWRWGSDDPDMPVVLLVHGFEGHRGQFGAMIDALLERGYAAVRFTEPFENFAHQHQNPRVECPQADGSRQSLPLSSQAADRKSTRLNSSHT